MRISTILLGSLLLTGSNVMLGHHLTNPETHSIKLYEMAGEKKTFEPKGSLSKVLPYVGLNSENEPITNVSGTVKNYIRSGIGYQNQWDSMVEYVAGKFVTDNSTVYIYNPLSFFPTGTYMEGTLVDNETIKVDFPQLVYIEEYEGEVYNYYVNKLNFIFDEGSDETGWYFVDEEDNSLSYKLVDGSWALQGTDMARSVLGITDDFGEWMGFADFMTVYEPFNEEPLTPPSNLVTEEWALTYGQGDGRFVSVGILDDEMYVKGIFDEFPEAWIKGDIEEDKVIFTSKQLLGTDRFIYHYDYFFGGDIEEVYDEDIDYSYQQITINDELVFDYDSENKYLSSNGAGVVNSNPDYQSYFEWVDYPVLTVNPTDMSLVPANPEITYWEGMDDYYGMGYMYFNVPIVNKDGYLLNVNNLYYKVWLDDEPYEFSPDLYPSLEEETELIPVTFNDWFDISVQGIEHFLALYMEGYEKIGVQSVYKDGDQEFVSDICYYGETPSGVYSLTDDKSIASTVYYDLNGRLVTTNTKGVLIKRIIYSDGSVKNSKIMNR